MILDSVFLQHFRSYTSQKFEFSPQTTIVVGPNTAGKTNLVESMYLLSRGKSFRGQDEENMIAFGQEVGRVQGMVVEGGYLSREEDGGMKIEDGEKIKLEVAVLSRQTNQGRFGKKFFVNGVTRSRMKFVGGLPLVLFRPEELDIIIAGPGHRRAFLDEVLEGIDREYYHASIAYEKALRQRNALLDLAKETGRKNEKQFEYWDNMVIENGTIITHKREELIAWINAQKKEVFDFTIVYDHSKISIDRLLQYEQAEVASGTTLVGPHRDDFYLEMSVSNKRLKDFGSRGQQRLAVLQLKLLQIEFVSQKLNQRPLLILDDIFSELDSGHIQLVLDKANGGQRIITTTHKEFVDTAHLTGAKVIEL